MQKEELKVEIELAGHRLRIKTCLVGWTLIGIGMFFMFSLLQFTTTTFERGVIVATMSLLLIQGLWMEHYVNKTIKAKVQAALIHLDHEKAEG